MNTSIPPSTVKKTVPDLINRTNADDWFPKSNYAPDPAYWQNAQKTLNRQIAAFDSKYRDQISRNINISVQANALTTHHPEELLHRKGWGGVQGGAAEPYPPCSNMGDTDKSTPFDHVIDTDIPTQRVVSKEAIYDVANIVANIKVNSIVFVDAVVLTVAEAGDGKAYNELVGMLQSMGIAIELTGKGANGYRYNANLVWHDDRASTNLGQLSYNDEIRNGQGLRISLMGEGSEFIRSAGYWADLFVWAVAYHARLARIDCTSDYEGGWMESHGYTVPALAIEQSWRFKNNKAPRLGKFTQAGDWSRFFGTGMDAVRSYSALDEDDGLTAYFGSRGGKTPDGKQKEGSPTQIRIYEKGKQMLGKVPKPDRKAAATEFDLKSVRVEIELHHRRGYPLDIMLMLSPETAFTQYDGLYALHQQYVSANFCDEQDKPLINTPRKRTFQKKKGCIVSKVYWARHSYGAVVSELKDLGMTDTQVVQMVTKGKSSKGQKFGYWVDNPSEDIWGALMAA